ncbi:MAG: MFS transporter [Blastocatellia bacterium]|nr:MFS transporter [Blastocatellia bacterium]
MSETSRFATLAACLLILVALIDSQVVGAVTPQIAAGLGAAKTLVASSVTAYALAAAAVALGLGRFGKRMRPSLWLPLSSLIFGAASLLAASAPHIAVFFAARALAGLAGGLISALAIAALANASSYATRGRQMSGVAISYFLAPVLGVPLGAFLTGRFGWRSVFLLSAVLVILAGALVWLFPLPDAAAKSEHSSESEKQPVHQSLWKLATRSRSSIWGIVSAAFVSGGLVGFTTYLGSWLADAFFAKPNQVGSIYALAGVGAVFGGAFGGRLADRFGKRAVAVWSSIGMLVLLLMVPTFSWSLSLFVLIGLAAFLAAVRVAPLQALITELVPPTDRATYIALRNGASQLGIAATVALAGRMYPGWGFSGVGFLCAILTFFAWQTVRVIEDPHHDGDKPVLAPRPLWLRLVRSTVAIVLIFVVVVIPYALSFVVTKAGTRPDERIRTDTPAGLGAQFQDVQFVSSDGNTLSGWYLPATKENVTIVMTHGLFRSRYELLERGVRLWKAGYGVVLYDLRRHGKSPAEFATSGYTERHDVLGALEFARKAAPGHKIVLLGISMGATATLLAAAETKDVAAVIAESSFLSFSETAWRHVGLAKLPRIPVAPMVIGLTAWRMNFFPSAFDARAAVQHISCPILFIGGTADVRMPNAETLEPLFAAAVNPHKEKLIVENARHGHAFDVAPDTYVTTVVNFLHKNL